MARASERESYGEWPLKRLMTEVVGSGHKSADDMDRAQSREAMARILDLEPDPTTLGAFWLANRWKRNTPEELAAFVDEMIDAGVERGVPDADPVDCGAAYDGKHTTAILGVAAGAVAAAAGTPVAIHSGDRVPTQKLPVYRDVLEELGVRWDLSPEESATMVDETGVGFYHQPAFNPGIDALWDRRDQMGVRTFLNTIETLANPAGASTHLGSFYHLPFAKRIVDTLHESEHAGFERVVMFQGLEGYDDVRPGLTTVAEWDASEGTGGDGEEDAEGSFRDYEIQTAEYGLDVETDDLAVEDVAADSAAITESVLRGEREDAFADAVAINAAVRIYAGGDTDSVETGLTTARDALADGSAAAVLDDLRAF